MDYKGQDHNSGYRNITHQFSWLKKKNLKSINLAIDKNNLCNINLNQVYVIEKKNNSMKIKNECLYSLSI